MNGQFLSTRQPTFGVEVHPLRYETSHGNVSLNLWDCGGEYQGLIFGYWIQANAAIVLVDLNSQDPLEQATRWIGELRQHCGNIPIIVCGNKADLTHGNIEKELYKLDIQYYSISCLSMQGFEEPFIYLLRQLLQEENLQIVGLSHTAKLD